MAPLETDSAAQWTKQIQDALAGNSGMREGLRDDEALPLVNWGAEQAETIAQRLAEADTPAPNAEQIDMAAYTLGRLLTRITWVVTYRDKKDAAWLTRTFAKINALSQELFGPDAPALSDEEIAAWIAEQPNRTNGELVNDLIARLTPERAAPAEVAPDDAPDDEAPEIGAPPAGQDDADEWWHRRLYRALFDEPPAEPPDDSSPTQGHDDI